MEFVRNFGGWEVGAIYSGGGWTGNWRGKMKNGVVVVFD